MGFKCGIVGLPNVGKSTLFNALTETQAAQAANYPFCTIEPNVGNVGVPDPRLDTLAKSDDVRFNQRHRAEAGRLTTKTVGTADNRRPPTRPLTTVIPQIPQLARRLRCIGSTM